MMDKLHLTKQQETSLLTLHARAIQNGWPHPILSDPWAEAAYQQIDCDLKRELHGYEIVAIASRAATFDLYTRQYLAAHPDATVLNLGCGLDSRVYRIDPPPTVRWFDVDYPQIIDLHRLIYPERAGYQRIGADLGDTFWSGKLPQLGPALILAEGLMMYLTEQIVGTLLICVVNHFASGELIFDAINGWEANHAEPGDGLEYTWWLKDPAALTKVVPRLQCIEELPASHWVGFSEYQRAIRLLIRGMDRFPALMRMNRLLRYRF